MKPSEGMPRPLIVDPRGAPLDDTSRIVLPTQSLKSKATQEDLIISGLQQILPPEFRGKKYDAGDGLISLPAEKTHGPLIETDLAAAPKDLEAEKEGDYFGFEPAEIAAVQKAHQQFKKNLYTGLPEQQGIYLARLMGAAGFPSEHERTDGTTAFVRRAAEAVAKERAEKPGEKATMPREGFLASYCRQHDQPAHPTADAFSHEGNNGVAKRLDRQGDQITSGKKDYSGEVPYRQLALMLLPDIWNDLKPKERVWALDSLLMLYEYTTNASEIDSPELFLRVADIARTEQDVGVRSLIYLLCDTVPYDNIPNEAKVSLAGTIAKHQEYNATFATSLLTDKAALQGPEQYPALAKLRQEYLAFRADVLGRLSGDINELASLSLSRWTNLVKDVERLNLLTITNDTDEAARLQRETIGIELEYPLYAAALSQAVRPAELKDAELRVSIELRMQNSPHGLQRGGIDQDCIEVRTDGPVPVMREAFTDIHKTVRAVEHFLPGDVGTFHLHVERTKSAGGFKELFLEAKDNDIGTLELRSFRAPTLVLPEEGRMRARTQRADPLMIERAALFSTLSEGIDFEETESRTYELEGFPPREGLRKLLALELCGDDPRQRAAAIQLIQRPPLFLAPRYVAQLAFALAPADQTFDYFVEGRKMIYKQQADAYVDPNGPEREMLEQALGAYVEDTSVGAEPIPQEVEGLLSDYVRLVTKNGVEHLSPKVCAWVIDVTLRSGGQKAKSLLLTLLPLAAPEQVPKMISFLRERGVNRHTDAYPDWYFVQPDAYARLRTHLSVEDRQYLYNLLLSAAVEVGDSLEEPLREFLEDADESARQGFYLIFGSARELSKIEAALEYEKNEHEISAVNRNDDYIVQTVFFKLFDRLISSGDEAAVLFVLNQLSDYPKGSPVRVAVIDNACVSHISALERAFDRPEEISGQIQTAIYERMLTHLSTSRCRQFVLDHYVQMDSSTRRSLYRVGGAQVRTEVMSASRGGGLQALLQGCFAREQDQNIRQRAMELAIEDGFFLEDPAGWSRLLDGVMREGDMHTRQALLGELLRKKDPAVLEVVGVYFPYGLRWEDPFVEDTIRRLAWHFGFEGRGFLTALYKNDPSLVVKQAIEAHVPSIASSSTQQEAQL